MSRKLISLTIGIVLVLLFIVFSHRVASSEGHYQVLFMDVGQGDSALISDQTGFNILIDGGKYAGPTVIANLREQGIDHIDVMLASHADSDHIGGLIDVLNLPDIPVYAVYYNGYPGDTSTWDEFAAAVANEGLALTPIQFPLELAWGDTTVYVLNPVSGLVDPETNQASVVLLLKNGNIDYLFTGDIDSTVEATVVARGTPVAAEILKVAHHGSAGSSSESFLAAVQPAEAVISVATDNPYGHPSDETIARLIDIGANIWRTDLSGNILVDSDGVSYLVITEAPDYVAFIPIVIQSASTPQPTEPVTTDIVISDIFYDGVESNESDEYVEIRNDGNSAVELLNWTLRDSAEHVYTFPSYSMAPGEVCRIYTSEYHPEYCGFDYGSGLAIWNNSGDCGYLRDASSTLVDEYCY